jgi:putative spermidine/putrescine transport system permease protein
MVVVYLATLVLLFLSAFWRLDPFSGLIERSWGLQNFRTLLHESVYRIIALRTVGIAAAVTVADIALAFPLAYYAARIARPRARSVMLLAVVLPLWSSYLVRVYAWRVILSGGGFLSWLLAKAGLGTLQVGYSAWAVWIVFCYLWLPFVVLPIYAALERIPSSFLEASSDLGAHGWHTFRRVIWPLAFPGIVAGSIFSFSLTLGDYIAPDLVGNTKFIGNVVYANVGVANNVPFAAAYALVPVAIMAAYLVVARRLRAFEAL